MGTDTSKGAAGGPILNIDNLDYRDFGDGGKFEARIGPIGRVLGAQKLGYQLVAVAPGKAAWPYHLHHANEEMFFIVEGEGTLRYDGTDYPVRAGDCICGPVGPGTARQIRNTSNAELKYLAVSTMITPEVAEYPDSGKLFAMAGDMANAKGPQDMDRRFVGRLDAAVDYFDGESE